MSLGKQRQLCHARSISEDRNQQILVGKSKYTTIVNCIIIWFLKIIPDKNNMEDRRGAF